MFSCLICLVFKAGLQFPHKEARRGATTSRFWLLPFRSVDFGSIHSVLDFGFLSSVLLALASVYFLAWGDPAMRPSTILFAIWKALSLHFRSSGPSPLQFVPKQKALLRSFSKGMEFFGGSLALQCYSFAQLSISFGSRINACHFGACSFDATCGFPEEGPPEASMIFTSANVGSLQTPTFSVCQKPGWERIIAKWLLVRSKPKALSQFLGTCSLALSPTKKSHAPYCSKILPFRGQMSTRSVLSILQPLKLGSSSQFFGILRGSSLPGSIGGSKSSRIRERQIVRMFFIILEIRCMMSPPTLYRTSMVMSCSNLQPLWIRSTRTGTAFTPPIPYTSTRSRC